MNFFMPLRSRDEVWLFERIVRQLQKRFGHGENEAVAFVNRYCEKFTDPGFCDLYNLSVQTIEFFAREESLAMADRIQFHVVMGNEPDEMKFIAWENKLFEK